MHTSCRNGRFVASHYNSDTVKSYAEKHCAEEHQPRFSLGNENIFSLRFCRNKNIDFDSGKTSKV